MDLSIIIPLYNQEDCLEYCLTSIIDNGLEDKNYEILIVNDGSTDKSELIAIKFQKNHNNVRIITQVNSGVGSARNRGIKNAEGTYIYMLDPDDYILPGTLEILISTAKKHSLELVTFKSSQRNIRKNNEKPKLEVLKNNNLEIKDGISYMSDDYYLNQSWWYMIERKFLLDSGCLFLKKRKLQDTIFTPQLFMKSKRVAHIPLDVHRYIVHPKSSMNSKETNHYVNLISDYEYAAYAYTDIINQLFLREADVGLVKKMKAQQAAFVFFLFIRIYKSGLNSNDLNQIKERLKAAQLYPIKNFIGVYSDKLIYKILVFIFNNKVLLKSSFVTYRFFK